MLDVVTIAGSPAAPPRCAAVLDRARDRLEELGWQTAAINVRDLHPEELVWGQTDGPSVVRALDLIERARAVMVATPVYEAAYSGVLKSFLDLLPPGVLDGKAVLPIATAGSLAHGLALEYALKPVLSALGARYVLAGFCVLDADMVYEAGRPVRVAPEADGRLTRSLGELEASLDRSAGREARVLQELTA